MGSLTSSLGAGTTWRVAVGSASSTEVMGSSSVRIGSWGLVSTSGAITGAAISVGAWATSGVISASVTCSCLMTGSEEIVG